MICDVNKVQVLYAFTTHFCFFEGRGVVDLKLKTQKIDGSERKKRGSEFSFLAVAEGNAQSHPLI